MIGGLANVRPVQISLVSPPPGGATSSAQRPDQPPARIRLPGEGADSPRFDQHLIRVVDPSLPKARAEARVGPDQALALGVFAKRDRCLCPRDRPPGQDSAGGEGHHRLAGHVLPGFPGHDEGLAVEPPALTERGNLLLCGLVEANRHETHRGTNPPVAGLQGAEVLANAFRIRRAGDQPDVAVRADEDQCVGAIRLCHVAVVVQQAARPD